MERPAWTLKPVWALLALVPPVLCVIVSSVLLSRYEAALDAANRSITENAAPGVLFLSSEQAYLRQIELHALLAKPASVDENRARIADLQAEVSRIDAAYRRTDDYPGEYEAYARMLEDRARFYAAVDALLVGVEGGGPPSGEARAALLSTTDTFAASIGQVIRVNADQIRPPGRR